MPRPIRGQGGSRNSELILIKCQVWASGMFCSVRENARNYTSPRKKIKMKDSCGNNKTKFFRLRLFDEVGTEILEKDLRLT